MLTSPRTSPTCHQTDRTGPYHMPDAGRSQSPPAGCLWALARHLTHSRKRPRDQPPYIATSSDPSQRQTGQRPPPATTTQARGRPPRRCVTISRRLYCHRGGKEPYILGRADGRIWSVRSVSGGWPRCAGLQSSRRRWTTSHDAGPRSRPAAGPERAPGRQAKGTRRQADHVFRHAIPVRHHRPRRA